MLIRSAPLVVVLYPIPVVQLLFTLALSWLLQRCGLCACPGGWAAHKGWAVLASWNHRRSLNQ